MKAETTLLSGASLDALDLPDTIEVIPTGGTCGVRIRGLDLSRDPAADEIWALKQLADHAGFVVVEGQKDFTVDRQSVLLGWLGGAYLPPEVDGGIERPRREYVNAIGPDGGSAGTAEVHPHTDNQPTRVTPDFTILYAVEVPPPDAGGNTDYANLVLAYDELPDDLRERIRGLGQRVFKQKWANYRCFDAIRAALDAKGDRPPEHDPSDVVHPVVRTHPVTGRPALWVSNMTDHVIVDGNADAERALTDRLVAHVNQDHLYTRHEWSLHDLVVWDNRCVLHRRQAWDPRFRRVMVASQAGCGRPF